MFGKKEEESLNPQQVEIARHLRLADQYFRDGRYGDALIETDTVLQIDPRNYAARGLRERVLAFQKRAEQPLDIKPAPTVSREALAKHLRNADQYIRTGRYQEAMIELEYVLGSDPKNYLARTMQERIKIMQRGPTAPTSAQTQADEMEKKLEAVSQFLKSAEQYVQTKQYKLALAQIAKVFAIDPKNHYAQAYSERIDQLMNQQQVPPVQPKSLPRPGIPPVVAIPKKPPKEKSGRLLMYAELLKEMWFDGKLDDVELKELANTRSMFKISDEEHADIEHEVKINAYVEALRMAMHDGSLSDGELDVLQYMREKYSITIEEHMTAEASILMAKTQQLQQRKILIVDDDIPFLEAFALSLKDRGFFVASADSVEKALPLLEQQPVDIIVSDVMFPIQQMDGFEFYKRVRQNKKLDNIPFLLMSGVIDEYVMRAGMRLGVDGYLKKPFDLELLFAMIEGQLNK
jgi:CheY-like chemotaxis protein